MTKVFECQDKMSLLLWNQKKRKTGSPINHQAYRIFSFNPPQKRRRCIFRV